MKNDDLDELSLSPEELAQISGGAVYGGSKPYRPYMNGKKIWTPYNPAPKGPRKTKKNVPTAN